ncbi:DUF4822 domain-containing protein [Nocardioides daejeonensis]|uniref:DUF4822 domain-containing protein n=1 Tax=Nocardioides daejeonensis TaxID=1046556 RepID=UPI000D74E04E|nr:DUF4822 domain-containing protein [Nocardioides daejeonensis]
MNTITSKSLRTAVVSLVALGVFAACGTDSDDAEKTDADQSSQVAQAATPSDILAATPWETTSAVDQDGNEVSLDDENVNTFVGWAYFKADGTFTMYTLDDAPKMQGDWTVTEDGKTRSIVAKDEDGKVLFTRDSDIVTLTDAEFTYRVFPEEGDTSAYYDIVHTPTDHAEPTA